MSFPFRPIRLFSSAAFALFSAGLASALAAGPLEDYLRRPDDSFSWKLVDRKDARDSSVLRLEMTSQTWRDHVWTHQMLVVRPAKVRNHDIALLYINGDGDPAKSQASLEALARAAGAVTAMINRTPNQPLYDGRKEDSLIAYTFNEYDKSGDKTWPLLFPMVKGAVRGLDTITAAVRHEFKQDVKRFVVTGASKRGWTTWLTAAVDKRVAGIAPMVIDTLNMPAQLDWARRVYGKQSEKIRDYTDLRLDERKEEPRIKELLGWVDPFSYRRTYTMPKLLLLGTNDPYWTVDSLRHYWNELLEPKFIYQTPNAGHDLGGGREALKTLAAFYQMIADGEALPHVTWSLKGGTASPLEIEVRSSQPMLDARLWTANSKDRDLRDDKWSDKGLSISQGGTGVKAEMAGTEGAFRAGLVEVELRTKAGLTYKLSSEARVVPDVLPGEKMVTTNGRKPKDDAELRYWLGNMDAHDFSLEEMQAATGLDPAILRGALERPGVDRHAKVAPLTVFPYPGGRHPRTGFLEGAVDPQRETKISVFPPWKDGGYAVVDVPEAIWSNLGLTYLAHTHVPTLWSKQGTDLSQLEWNRHADGTLDFERQLPNGIAFGSKVMPRKDGVRMEMWLRNGTKNLLSDLRVQNCLMLKALRGFEAQSNEGKVLSKPFAAAPSDDGNRWVIIAWEPCNRPWANPPCPCLHSDPKFPDLKPGETGQLRGWVSFYEGRDVDAELARIRGLGWLNAGTE